MATKAGNKGGKAMTSASTATKQDVGKAIREEKSQGADSQGARHRSETLAMFD